jgi:hypothetical protein
MYTVSCQLKKKNEESGKLIEAYGSHFNMPNDDLYNDATFHLEKKL